MRVDFAVAVRAAKITFLLLCILLIFNNLAVVDAQGDSGLHTNSDGSLSISDVSVLLSWNSKGTQLQAFGSSCFTWHSSDYTALEILPHSPCSNKITVVPRQGFDSRRTVVVTAIDHVTGNSVSCEIFIDKIHKLKLLTTVRKLVIGELQILEVQAFDRDDNVFTTLDGLRFKWSWSPVDDNYSTEPAMRLLALDDPSVRLTIEQKGREHGRGLETSSVVAKGTRIGQATVTVKLAEPGYNDVEPDTVLFAVVDKLTIVPSITRVAPACDIHFTLQRKENEQFNAVPMPSDRFTWYSSNPTVATIDEARGIMTTISLGEVYIGVKDKIFPMNELKMLIHVVEPRSLSFSATPVNDTLYKGYEELSAMLGQQPESNQLVEHNQYDVEPEVYDTGNNKIYTCNLGFDFAVVDGKEHVDIVSQSPLNQKIRVRAVSIGKTTLRAALLGAKSKQSYEKFTPQQPIHSDKTYDISPKITIQYPLDTIYLPIDDEAKQEYRPKVVGGSGFYRWYSLNPDVLIANTESGVIISNHEGETYAVVFDQLNMFNGDSRKVSISRLATAEFRDGPREAAVDSDLCVEVIARDARGNAFANFTSLGLIWSTLDPTVFALPQPYSVAMYRKDYTCPASDTVFALRALSIGFTTVKMSYKDKMKDKIAIAAFPKLQIEEKDDPLLFALGSSGEITVTGGPRPWSNSSKITYQARPALANGHVRIDVVSKSVERRIYKLTCLSFGSQDLVFTVHHEIGVAGAAPTQVSVTRRFACEAPYSLTLAPVNDVTGEDYPALPIIQPMKVYNVLNNRQVPIRLSLFDKDNNKFTAFNSVDISWDLSDKKIGQLAYSPLEHKGRKMLSLGEEEGALIVMASAQGYKDSVLREAKAHATTGTQFRRISNEIELRVTSKAQIIPSRYVLFRSSAVSVVLRAQGGSGKFEFNFNNTRIATHRVVSHNSVELTGIKEGILGVTATDIQFHGEPASSTIIISDIAMAAIEGSHLIQLHNTPETQLNVLVMNSAGDIFDSKQYRAMNIRLEADLEGFAYIKKSADSDNGYVVTGLRPGTINVIASAENADGKRIISAPFQIHIYEPLKVDPPSLILIPGAIYQVRVLGGPVLPHEKLVNIFTIEKTKKDANHPNGPAEVIKIDEKGVVTGIWPGSATIGIERRIQRIPGPEGIVGKLSVNVDVVLIDSLVVPATVNVYEGYVVPFTVSALSATGQQILPISMQSPYLNVTVSIATPYQSDQFELVAPYSANNALIRTSSVDGSHSIFVNGKTLGRNTLKATAIFKHPILKSTQHTAFSEVNVVQKLKEIRGHDHADIIVPPHSSYHIRTNRDRLTSLKYTLMTSTEYDTAISVSSNGKISSTGNEGVSVVMIEDIVDGQVTSVEVEVKRPHLISLEHDQYSTLKLPIGSDVVLPVRIQDIRGDYFSSPFESHTEENSIFYRMNLQDVVQVDYQPNTNNVVLRAIASGNTTLQVYTKPSRSPSGMVAQVAFFARISVIDVIEPTGSPLRLHVGDTATFTLRSHDLWGSWYSSNDNVIKIDPSTGVAVAQNPGEAQITFKCDTFTTYRKVQVVRFAQSKLETPESSYLTLNSNPKRLKDQRTFTLPITFLDNNGQPFHFTQYHLVNHNAKVECLSNSPLVTVTTMNTTVDDASAPGGKATQFLCEISPRKEEAAKYAGQPERVEGVNVDVVVRAGNDKYTLSTGSLPLLITPTPEQVKREDIRLPEKPGKKTDEIAVFSSGVLATTIVAALIILACFKLSPGSGAGGAAAVPRPAQQQPQARAVYRARAAQQAQYQPYPQQQAQMYDQYQEEEEEDQLDQDIYYQQQRSAERLQHHDGRDSAFRLYDPVNRRN